MLFTVFLLSNQAWGWISRKHHDGSEWDGWFIAGVNHPFIKTITYHLPIKYWELLEEFVEVRETAPEWDGHTSFDVLRRLLSLALLNKDVTTRQEHEEKIKTFFDIGNTK